MALLTFDGIELLPVPPAVAFQLLTDLDLLATLLPDVAEQTLVNSTAAKWTIRPGFSFLRGTLHLDVVRENCDHDDAIQLHLSATGIGLKIELDVNLTIRTQDAGTQVQWRMDVTKLAGLVATVGKSLIRGAAEETIRNTWAKINEYCNKTRS